MSPGNTALTAAVAIVGFLTLWAWLAQQRRWLQFLHHLQRLRRAEPTAADTNLRDVWGAEDLNHMVLEVCGQLRAGTAPSVAWEKTWGRRQTEPFTGMTAANEPLFLLHQPHAAAWRRLFQRRQIGETETISQAITLASRFSHQTGAPLADVLERVVEGVTAETESRENQRQAFAGPQLSATILTALPLAAVLAGEALGANPLQWFFSGGVGAMVGVTGVALVAAGWWVSRRMIASAQNATNLPLAAALNCDLVAAAVRSGASVPAALRSLGVATGVEEWGRIGAELVLGAPWAEAWDPVPPGGEVLSDALRSGWEDGVSPLVLLRHMARRARDTQASKARVAAARLSVKLVAPLGLLLLPAFVALGVVPIAVTLLSGQLHGW